MPLPPDDGSVVSTPGVNPIDKSPAVAVDAHPRQPGRAPLSTGILLIASEKLVRGALFLLLGLGALHLIHQNLGDVILRWTLRMHLNPGGPRINQLLDRADLVSTRQLQRAGALSIAYAAVAVTEGVGLLLRKAWAEYLTLGLTLLALPLEVAEIFRHPLWTRFALLGINLLVAIYLVLLVRHKRAQGTL